MEIRLWQKMAQVKLNGTLRSKVKVNLRKGVTGGTHNSGTYLPGVNDQIQYPLGLPWKHTRECTDQHIHQAGVYWAWAYGREMAMISEKHLYHKKNKTHRVVELQSRHIRHRRQDVCVVNMSE